MAVCWPLSLEQNNPVVGVWLDGSDEDDDICTQR